MNIRDLLYISVKNFQNRKSRVVFTALGVAIAIGAVLFLVSLGYGLQRILLEKITTTESLLSLDIIPSDPSIHLNEEKIQEILALPNVEKISPQASVTAAMYREGVTAQAIVNLVQPDIFQLEGVVPAAGRFFTREDRHQIVVNATAAKLFNETPEGIVGKDFLFLFLLPKEEEEGSEIETVQIEQPFTVAGVVERGESNGEVFMNRVDVPDVRILEYQFAKVKVLKSGEPMEQTQIALLEKGFRVSALSDTIDQANKIFRIIQIVLGVFGIIALVVAAIGLVNTMTISLLERTNEIGIMRAIGAAPQDVRRIFLGEAMLIGFIGGVSGIILGILFSEGVNTAFNLMATSFGGKTMHLFYYPPWFLVFIIALSTLVGWLGGAWPARRASKMNPLDALRYK